MLKAKLKTQLERSWLVQEVVEKISSLDRLSRPHVCILNVLEKFYFCAKVFNKLHVFVLLYSSQN